MSDWPPRQEVTPLFVTSWGRFAANTDIRGVLGAPQPASMAWPTANLAMYVPFAIPFNYPVRRVFWVNGATVTGTFDFGIYTLGGARIYSTGATAQSGASVPQYITPTAFVLTPGRYYFALSCNGTTGLGFGAVAVTTTEGRFAGLLQQGSAATLPASATFAAWASTGYPLFGITRTASGF
jgi:hypothetical protein